jgi:hypothetical protein
MSFIGCNTYYDTGLKLTIKNNVADCDCEAQVQKLYAQWKAKNVATTITQEVPVYIPAELSTWQKLEIVLGKILFFLIIALLIYAATRLYKKLRP